MIIALQTLVFFRESLVEALTRFISPYYFKLRARLTNYVDDPEEEEDEEVFAEFDEEKGVVFYPPVYIQRYAAVSDCLLDERWNGKLEKIVDLGYHDMSFIKYLKDMPGVRCILGVDIESILLKCSSDLLGCEDYAPKRESPLQVTLFQGNAADPDYRLIGCDAVVAIEMIEHMLPHDLERLVHTIFGFIKPWIVVITTPNGDFNALFKAMEKNGLRRCDHFFEWSREQFHDWCSNIVVRYPQFTVQCQGIGPGPPGTSHYGCCSQLALFVNKCYVKQQDLDLKSLEVVPKIPTPDLLSETTGFETPIDDLGKMICPQNLRLNCTTFQVTKFSKTTQNLMAKNKSDFLNHTREVVNEIRHLTNMLNWKQDTVVDNRNGHIWCNINWGENAPYWNQYYQIVREYNYPFEVKSDESRILDLISEEVNRLIDGYKDNDNGNFSKLQIPLEHLMKVVQHITTNVDMVKDVLEWNGYEIIGDKVIYNRMVVDTTSLASTDVEWPDNETSSELDTIDVQSTTVTETSNAPDYHGRLIRRVLDKKVRGLHEMLSADEDITTELDKIVCRLMKLALRSSKGRQTPLPTKWMQCKLIDLLTLTEKAISRRKRRNLDFLPMKAIGFTDNTSELIALLKIKTDNVGARKLVDKYKNLLEDVDTPHLCDPLDFTFEDEMREPTSIESSKDISNEQNSSSIFTNDNEKFTAYFNTAAVSFSSSGQLAVCSTPENSIKTLVPSTETISKKSSKRFHCKTPEELKYDGRKRYKRSNTNIGTKVTRKKSASTATRNQAKRSSEEFGIYGIKTRRGLKEFKKLYPTASKPIPNSIIELCHTGFGSNVMSKDYHFQNNKQKPKEYYSNKSHRHIGATAEETVIFDINMDDVEEIKNVPKLIGAENMEIDSTDFHLGKLTSNSMAEDTKTTTENVESQTIFLNDINEPSTSKGIRHIGMDVQCGTDSIPYGLGNSSASVTLLSNVFSNGIRIDSLNNIPSKANSVNVGTSDFDAVDSKIKSSALFSKGIKIEDSVESIIVDPSFDFSGIPKNRGVEHENSSPKNILINQIKDSLDVAGTKEYFYSRENDGERPLYPERNNPIASTKFIHSKHAETDRHENSPISSFNIGIKLKDSDDDVKTDNAGFGEYRTASQNSRFCEPECFFGIQPDSSLSNLLENFDLNTDIKAKTSQSLFISSECKYSENNNFESLANHNIASEIENTDSSKRDSLKSPLLITSVKMIDVINDVSIERNTEVQYTAYAPPEPCRLVTPTTYGSELPQLVCQIPCQLSNIATSTEAKAKIRNKKSVSIEEPSGSIESQYDSGIASYFITKNNFTDTSSTNTNQERYSNGYMTPERNVYGFKIKDLNDNVIKKVEVSMTRVELLSEGQVCESPPSPKLSSKTEFIKSAISVSKTEDSAFGVCDIPRYETSSFYKGSSNELNKGLLAVRRKLSCTCIHVHSYKKSLEDMVYYGKWKNHVQKILGNSVIRQKSSLRNSVIRKKSSPGHSVIARKPSHGNTVTINKIPDATNRKFKSYLPKRIKTIDTENKVKVEQKKPVQVRSVPPTKVKQGVINENVQIRKAVPPVPTKQTEASKVRTKVSSRIRSTSVAAKNTVNVVQVSKNKTESPKNLQLNRNYLPGYLRKRKLALNISNLNSSSDSDKNRIAENEIVCVPTNKVDEIKKNLLKMQTQLRNTSYMVFRNELENSSSTTNNNQSANTSNIREINNKSMNLQKRSSSPMSQNSSTDSTADSASTVKPNTDWPIESNRRQSVISNKSSTGNTDSDSSPSTKIKKVVRRTKTKKCTDIENKENIPQTSKKSGLDKENLHNSKGAFSSRNKIYMAQLPEGSGCGKKQTPTKSNIKLPVIETNEDKRKQKAAAVFRQHVQSTDMLIINSQDTSNVDCVVLVERKNLKDDDVSNLIEEVSPQAKNTEDDVKVVNYKLNSESLETSSDIDSTKECTKNATLDAMKQIVEEKLGFIRNSHNEVTSDSNLANLDESPDFDDNSSCKSFKTVVYAEDTDFNDTIKSEIENVMNHSLDFVLDDQSEVIEERNKNTDLEFLSFKSVTPTSRSSEYFMPDSYREGISNLPRQNNAGSVLDVFERKDMGFVKNVTGNRATQAFSGFSMNAESMMGDQPDFVPCYDSISEFDSTRQTSEELYVSGRSTPSFESCLVEEEVPVPDWLFQVHQRPDPVSLIDSETGSLAQPYHRLPIPEEDEEPPELIPLPLPLVEPVFDANGNVMEPGIGLGAGAGDGRGIHSDHSQDSSGRGSSLSSSDASSGQQSEAILIDPSTFTTPFELFHEPVGSSTVVTTLVLPDFPDHSGQGQLECENSRTVRNEALRDSCATTLTSDGEADVSSTDTDIPDSS